MEIHTTRLHGVKLITPGLFEDHRGSYLELFDSEKYRAVTAGTEFVQDDISISKRNVLRGLHGDWVTTKLVSVIQGRAHAVLADNREDSPTFLQWQSFELSRENRAQLLVPPGIGNSILALSDEVIYWYKQSTHFVEGRQFTIKWNDPAWQFDWPIDDPILSQRDRRGEYVEA